MMIENGFRAKTDFVIHDHETSYACSAPMSQWYALVISGSKVNAWGISDWKRYLDHNWLCNQAMITKLHTSAPYESRMCLIDFGVKDFGLLGITNGQGWSMLIQRFL